MPERKLVIIATHAEDDPERATIPFAMATVALASEVEVTVVLQADGVWLGTKDYSNRIKAEAFPSLSELMTEFRQLGGALMVCAPCMAARKIDAAQLIPGTKTVTAGTIVDETVTASATLVY